MSKQVIKRPAPSRSKRNGALIQSALATTVMLSPAKIYTSDRREVSRLVIPAINQLASVSSTGVLINLFSAVAQGTDLNQRVGRSIQTLSYNLFGTLVGGQTNLATDDKINTVRIVFFEAAVGTLVSAVNSAWGLSIPADPRYAPGVTRVLRDELFTLTSLGRDSVGYMPASTTINMTGSYTKRLMYTSAAANSISGTCLFLFMISDSVAVPSPGFTSGAWVANWTE